MMEGFDDGFIDVFVVEGVMIVFEFVFDGESWVEIIDVCGECLLFGLNVVGCNVMVCGFLLFVIVLGNVDFVCLIVDGEFFVILCRGC